MKKQNLQTLKGFRDFLPEEALKRKWLENKIRFVFELWGYDPLETPTLEPLEIFEGQIGEEEKLFYKFKDPGGRDVALRYDQTIPVCRVVGQYDQQLTMPFRRYQIQPAFRAEKPQMGRYREFLQADADIFGVESPIADAELIALSLDIYRQIGFSKARALINDRSLLTGIPYKAIAAIDKIKKIGEEGVVDEMIAKGINKKQAEEYLDTVKNLKPNKTIETILNYLTDQGFDTDWFKFDPTIARSFSYSTGPIWEIEIPGFEAGSVLGGERFDMLVENISGKKVPGTGFGLGFDRTLEAAEKFGLVPILKTVTQVLVTVIDKKMLSQSILVTKRLRKENINTELYPDSETKLDKQLKYASKKQIPWVIVIGPKETKKKTVNLKNMKSGEQRTLPLAKVIDLLRS